MLSIANTISSKADYPEITEILGGHFGFLVGLKPEEGDGHRSPFQRKKEKKSARFPKGRSPLVPSLPYFPRVSAIARSRAVGDNSMRSRNGPTNDGLQ
jgi:hypothetical protein